VHGTTEIKHLGKPASDGCVRLAPENARILFAVVEEKGLENTEIVLNGERPRATQTWCAGTRKTRPNTPRRTPRPCEKVEAVAGVRRSGVRAPIYAQRLGSLFPVSAVRLLPAASRTAELHGRLSISKGRCKSNDCLHVCRRRLSLEPPMSCCFACSLRVHSKAIIIERVEPG
jgi:hypothetical protein